ncbi:uncharacterized protein LOC123508278 isoform X2 [Portunus trituberculatus]|uniref:uncharacterized protein LOC123508278 isoform X2 n=1 Tax=Portunus trituberculatus TaxID=210409 RepID=UPI001E1D0A34|nr:uncharacterized protein LOC123508278 isoform X2 [Portunus trituberculatus]
MVLLSVHPEIQRDKGNSEGLTTLGRTRIKVMVLKAAMCGRPVAKEEAGVPGKDGKDARMAPHGYGSPAAPRFCPGRVLAQACPAPACTAMAVLFCSLVQLAGASLPVTAPSFSVPRPTPRLPAASEVFAHHGLAKTTAGSRHIHPAEDTVARAARSIPAIQRVEMHGPPLPHRKTLFVEVVVLADVSLYTHYGSRQDAEEHIAQVLSVANRVLGGLGVMVVAADVQVWWNRDEMRVTSRLDTNIARLQEHRLWLLRQYPRHPNDHTILLTRKQMRGGGGSCGAPLRGMCRRQQSVSVVQDEKEGPSVTGVALAHEVGHSLGIEDDSEDPDHACRCDTATCVMSRHFRNGSNPGLEWSGCSRQAFDSALKTLALSCLTNAPTTMHRNPRCGDGIVDDGEQCDCGPAEFCNNPCCLADTCTLAPHASCASGSCCDPQTCTPKTPGAMCRAAATECDLPEFCSGHSEYCPRDVTRADGEVCREGHCFKGECGSREGQCKRVWGDSASVAPSECYSALNVHGNRAGNCGLRAGGFHRCHKEDSLCGTLHCIAPASSSRLLEYHGNGSERVGPHTCHFISGSEEYPAQHWLTPDGTSCGPGKMCVEQRCQTVPKLSGECHGGCSGHGVCNSLGHCHCDTGFAPPNCFLPGLGGSVDSNVMSDVYDPWMLITLAWVATVLLLSLGAVTCCLWGWCKGWYKSKGRDKISGIVPCCAACLDACCCPITTKAVRWMLTVGSDPEKKQANTNIEVDDAEKEHMLCSVGVEVKGSLQTNTWGVADDKLVTEMVTIEPKDSPDFRREVKLPPDSPLLHHKSANNLHRPTYQQSISMDSGCVSDSDEDVSGKRTSLQLSMGSLVSLFFKFGDKKPKTALDNETVRTKSFGSQKSIPLSRFVVDPLARGSRQGTPPPHSVKPMYNRSFSTDVISNGRNRKEGTPPLPPSAALKPNKSEENLSKASGAATGGGLPDIPHSLPADAKSPVAASPDRRGAMEVASTASKVPPKPPKNKPLPSPPKVPPLKLGFGPQTPRQCHHEKPSPPHGAARPSPPMTPSRSLSSSPASTASNKVMEMARKFEVA